MIIYSFVLLFGSWLVDVGGAGNDGNWKDGRYIFEAIVTSHEPNTDPNCGRGDGPGNGKGAADIWLNVTREKD